MANKFQFKLLTSADPQAQYDAIVTKDDMTFYLLKNGVGYLGGVKLFDANSDIIVHVLRERLFCISYSFTV